MRMPRSNCCPRRWAICSLRRQRRVRLWSPRYVRWEPTYTKPTRSSMTSWLMVSCALGGLTHSRHLRQGARMIDSHSHIYMDRYRDDRDAVIARAATAGVTQLLQVGCDLEESRTVVALSAHVSGIYAAVGVHPHQATTMGPDVLDALEAFVYHPKVLAWGEIGLDFYYDHSPRDVQQAAFVAQLQRAIRCDVPVVIHTRDAEKATLDILQRYPAPRHGQVHCFTGTPAMAEQLLAMGFYLGFTEN